MKRSIAVLASMVALVFAVVAMAPASSATSTTKAVTNASLASVTLTPSFVGNHISSSTYVRAFESRSDAVRYRIGLCRDGSKYLAPGVRSEAGDDMDCLRMMYGSTPVTGYIEVFNLLTGNRVWYYSMGCLRPDYDIGASANELIRVSYARKCS